MNTYPKVLVACEQSQVVCKAFRHIGIEAYSNDILPCYGGLPEYHIIGDARNVVKGNNRFSLENGEKIDIQEWSMIIAHPPCTMLCHVSAPAASTGKHSTEDIKHAIDFFMSMLNAPASMVAVENPAPIKRFGLPVYNQIVNPYEFGHPYSKRVCLWLKNLPPLLPTCFCPHHKSWHDTGGYNSRTRSKTFTGIAEAIANQWGSLLF